MTLRIHATLVIACVFGLAACSPGSKQNRPPPVTAAPAKAQRYSVKGKVVSVDKAAKTVTVDHEAIPGFMDAMAMTYRVRDEHQLDNISSGESITAALVGGADGYWLEDVRAATTDAAK
jgi:protein SCO1/2